MTYRFEKLVKVWSNPPPKPRLKKPELVVMPTEDCPLPDQTPDMSDLEWVILCELVYSPLAKRELK